MIRRAAQTGFVFFAQQHCPELRRFFRILRGQRQQRLIAILAHAAQIIRQQRIHQAHQTAFRQPLSQKRIDRAAAIGERLAFQRIRRMLVAQSARCMAAAQPQIRPRRTVVQQHQLLPAIGWHPDASVKLHQRLLHQRFQLCTGQFAAGRHKRATQRHQQLRRALVHHRHTASGTDGQIPLHAQLSHAAQHHAAQLLRMRMRKSMQHFQRVLLAHGWQMQPDALRHGL